MNKIDELLEAKQRELSLMSAFSSIYDRLLENRKWDMPISYDTATGDAQRDENGDVIHRPPTENDSDMERAYYKAYTMLLDFIEKQCKQLSGWVAGTQKGVLMKYLNGHTKQGQRLIANANGFGGHRLDDIYKSYSTSKLAGYNWCYGEYLKTQDRDHFRVGNANTFGFCASWYGTLNGEPILRYETKDNSYIVWLNR